MLKRVARTCLHSLGAIAAFRRLHRRAVRILMYHHFSEDIDNLRSQCEHMRRFYNPVSLSDITNSLASGEPIPADAVVITIDDGYRDFFTNAHPVFRSFDVPTTVFLVTDFIDSRTWLWWDVVDYAVRNTDRGALTIGEKRFALQGDGAAEQISEFLKTLPNADRLQALQQIVDALEVELPANPPEYAASLSWDEVRRLASEGVEFGAHTKTHPILARIADSHELNEEISASKRRIEEELDRCIKHFCYPNGRFGDFDAAAVQLIRDAGYQSAVTAEPGMNVAGMSHFALRRLAVDPQTTSMSYFSELLAGVRVQ